MNNKIDEKRKQLMRDLISFGVSKQDVQKLLAVSVPTIRNYTHDVEEVEKSISGTRFKIDAGVGIYPKEAVNIKRKGIVIGTFVPTEQYAQEPLPSTDNTENIASNVNVLKRVPENLKIPKRGMGW